MPLRFSLRDVTSAKQHFLLEGAADKLECQRISVVGEADRKNDCRMSAHVERRGKPDQLQQRLGILAQRGHLRDCRSRDALRGNSKQIDLAEHAGKPPSEIVTALENLVVV